VSGDVENRMSWLQNRIVWEPVDGQHIVGICSCLSSGEGGLPTGENGHGGIQQELRQAQGESHHVQPAVGVYRSFREDQRERVREGFLHYSI
jgi:hypothetical protein